MIAQRLKKEQRTATNYNEDKNAIAINNYINKEWQERTTETAPSVARDNARDFRVSVNKLHGVNPLANKQYRLQTI
jgi:hypothetical protein